MKIVLSFRSTLHISITCWALGTGLGIYSVYGCDCDDRALMTHDLDTASLFNSYGMQNIRGASFQLIFNKWIFILIDGLALNIYLLVIIRLIWERCAQNGTVQFLNSQQIKQKMDSRVRLLLICFVSFLPNAVISLQQNFLHWGPPYGTFLVTIMIDIVTAIDSFVLVAMSSSVRRNLPIQFRRK
ncbi:hypothetical protein Ddc_02971 [Ditylenchus destructor]|nr:hypothetical protein Ddc_02971 [Ditylenchus destructor]